MKKKGCLVSKWERWAFPVFVVGVACLSKQIPLYAVYQPHLFESANYSILIHDFLNFGLIPNIEHYGGHMMTAVWEGVLYGLLNQDYTGAFVSPYAGLLDIVQILLFYYLIRYFWNAEMALLTTVFFPFYPAWSYFGYGMIVCLLVVRYVRQNSYFRAALLWGGFIWCALYRLDLGFAFGLSAVMSLTVYIIADRNKNALKQLSVTLVGWIAAGVMLWVVLCLSKGIHPISRLLEFLYVNLSNQNWAYKYIGYPNMSAFGWLYVLMPLGALGALAYTCISRKLRENIGMDRWILLMMLGFAYFVNFSRGLVRHSLFELVTYFTIFSGYVFLSLFVSSYKNNRKLILPVLMAFILCDTLLLSNENFSAESVAETSIEKSDAVIGEWEQLSWIDMPVQRVVLDQEMQKYAQKFGVLNRFLDQDETFVDFINKTTLYPILDRRCPVYVSQSPLQLSGEYMQREYIKQIAGIPLVLMPVGAGNYHNSIDLDGVANVYRYYLVSEYIYQNYVPLFRYGDTYAVWCLKEHYDLYKEKAQEHACSYNGHSLLLDGVTENHVELDKEENSVILKSTDTDPMIAELQNIIDLSACFQSEAIISVHYETDTRGQMEVFYTTELNEDYTWAKCESVEIAEKGTAVFTIPVTEHTRIRLDIPEQSTVRIFSIEVETPLKWINYGYDGPEILMDTDGNIKTANTGVYHNYVLKHLPRIWAEYDEKGAVNNKVQIELMDHGGIYDFSPESFVEKENGNYIKLTARYDGVDSAYFAQEDDEYIDATILMGSYRNGQFIEKMRYTMILQEGTHDYLLRCSTDYYWYTNQVNAVSIQADGPLQDVRISILAGD